MMIPVYKIVFNKGIVQFFLLIISLNCAAQGLSVNSTGTPADSSAMLDVSGVSKGVLINRMTTLQRNAINNPAPSLLIYNITTQCFEFYENGIWHSLGCACASPASPAAGTNNAAANQIEWNWNTVSGATGYKYNTVNNYNTAVDNGTYTSFTQTGLVCGGVSYTLYVWAYDLTCGCSAPLIMTQTTLSCPSSACGGGSVTFTYNGSTVTYGTVPGQNNTCWMDRNLGAAHVATAAYNDTLAYGDLFQWGRLDDGHQYKYSATTATLSINDVPGHPFFIVTTPSPFDWRTPQNNNLWQGVNGINNPCPAGWRIPTEQELENERLAWSQNDYLGAFASSLKLPSGSCRRESSSGSIGSGISSFYWTSNPNGAVIGARVLVIVSNNAYMDNGNRARGSSVRCIMN